MPVTSRKRRKPAERAKPTEGRECPSCGTALLSEARFCHACGTALDGSASGGIRSVRGLAWGGALVVVVALVVFAAAELSKRYGASSPPSSGALSPPRTAAPAAPNRPPDLSQMTPRGAADRLFNRIMTANEQGNLVEALRFVPMAVQAYGALPELDGDAHYHLGLIHELAGDNANLEAQITALRKNAPNHLLALMLEHGIAEKAGDKTAASLLLVTFVAAYDAEIATKRLEYEAHRGAIERFRAVATSGGARK